MNYDVACRRRPNIATILQIARMCGVLTNKYSILEDVCVLYRETLDLKLPYATSPSF